MAKAGVISIDINAGTAQFLVDMDKANVKLGQFGKGAQESGIHAVTSMQASSAAIRELAGGSNVRAIERLISMFPALANAAKMAFLPIAGIAFGVMLVDLGKKAIEFFQKMEQAPAKMAAAFRDLTQPLQLTSDQLDLSNARLANEIAKLEGKPENGLAIALDEARVAADQLAESLDKDLHRIQKVLMENKVGVIMQILGKAGTSDIEDYLKKFQVKVDEITTNGNNQIHSATNAPSVKGTPLFSPETSEALKTAAQTRMNTELTNKYAEAVAHLNELLKTAQSPGQGDATSRIKTLQAAIADLSGQADIIQKKSEEANLQGSKAGAEAAKANTEAAKRRAEEAKRAAKEATEALRKSDEDGLAADEQTYKASTSQLLSYWESRLAIEKGNGDRSADIRRKITQLNNQLDEEANRLAVETLRAGAQEREEEFKRGEELSKTVSGIGKNRIELVKSDAEEKKKLGDVGAAGTANAAEAGIQARKLEAERAYGLQITHTESQQITFMRALAQLESQQMSAKEAKLQTDLDDAKALGDELEIKKAQVALDKQLADDANARYEAQTKIQQKVKEQSFGGKLGADFQGIAQSAPGQLGGALAKGIIDGKGIGKDIRDSLKGIGQEMLGSVFKELIASLLLNTTATGGLTISTIAQTISTDAQTVATYALEAAEYIAALFGFADGGRPAPGVPYMVGENGPEIRVDDGPGTIIPNHMIGSAGSRSVGSGVARPGSNSSYGGHTFNVTQHIYDTQDAQESGRQFTNYLRTQGIGTAFSK
jgi:hypothetical protein